MPSESRQDLETKMTGLLTGKQQLMICEHQHVELFQQGPKV